MVRRLLLTTILLLTIAAAAFGSPDKATGANTVAVCGCGKVFVPDEKTEYITFNGKQYACCTHMCHEMAAKDPAASAKLAEIALTRTLNELNNVKFDVANVIAVTERGTRALCGCGKEFKVDESTEYLKYDGQSYACCTHACHEMAVKDPAAAAKAFAEHMKGTK